ncbi:hypothetical protein XCR1_1170008 [Xenorhabdus cabanillasii JM26]|uniref:Uncharacterized protein n=1 Tax=Xenorhabdus cabanillasii JM26 TaxID=1427517 RepID=W1IPJ4_9GAMM|nr:hypothetical protein XCR1_1170008 [Xenorhabdus cabanillasii JM26]
MGMRLTPCELQDYYSELGNNENDYQFHVITMVSFLFRRPGIS